MQYSIREEKGFDGYDMSMTVWSTQCQWCYFLLFARRDETWKWPINIDSQTLNGSESQHQRSNFFCNVILNENVRTSEKVHNI